MAGKDPFSENGPEVLIFFRHFTLLQETFMEQVQSSVLAIHVLFVPSLIHKSNPIFAASHFRGIG